MKSRHIPNKIDFEIKKLHFFECAWCGQKLTERHHITEFSNGGDHTLENLILLCPNCHTQAHRNEITVSELVQRKSTHVKGDRLTGGIPFEIKKPLVRLGNAEFKDVPILLMCKQNPLIELKKTQDEYFLSTRFYNKLGDLIFWMSSNRYWALSKFTTVVNKHELFIVNCEDSNNNLKITECEGFLNVVGKNYVNGMVLDFNPQYLKIGSISITSFSAENCEVGISIG